MVFLGSHLRQSVLLRFTLVSLIPLLLTIAAISYSTSQLIETDRTNELIDQSEIQSKTFESFFKQFLDKIDLVFKSPQVQKMIQLRMEDTTADADLKALPADNQTAGDFYSNRYSNSSTWRETQAFFLRLQVNDEDIDMIRIFWKDGNSVVGVKLGAPFNKDYRGDKVFFQQAMDTSLIGTNETHISPISIARATNSPAIRMQRVIDIGGERLGFFNINFNAASLTKTIEAGTFGKTGYNMLVDLNYENAEGELIGPVFISNILDPELTFNETVGTDIYIPVEDISAGKYTLKYTRNGESWLAGLSYVTLIGQRSFVVVSAQKESEIHAVRDTQLSIALGMLAGSIILIGFLAFTFSDSISKPVIAVSEFTKKLTKGELGASLDAKGKGEIEELITSVKNLQTAIVDLLNGINKSVNLTSETSYTLSSTSEEVNAVSEEVSATSQAMSQGASEQAEMIYRVNSQIVQASELIDAVISEINENTRIINDIALKTNILSLNAGIEASRAGDYGRGFTVVAENIRRLSEDTRDAIERIEEFSNNISQSLKKSFSDITESMEHISATAQETAASSEEVAASIEEIKNSIGEINELSSVLSTYAMRSQDTVTSIVKDQK